MQSNLHPKIEKSILGLTRGFVYGLLSCFGSNSNMHPYFEFFLSGSASIQKPYPAKFINSVLKIVLACHFCILGAAGLNLNSQAQPQPEAAKFESTPFGTFRIRRLSPEGGSGVVVPKVPFIRKRSPFKCKILNFSSWKSIFKLSSNLFLIK